MGVDISHELVIPAPIDRVFACVSTADGLNAWWTETASAEPRLAGGYAFGFGPSYQWRGVVVVYDAPRVIEWEMTETAPFDDWQRTRVRVELSTESVGTRLVFSHRGWPSASQHYRISSFCWAQYLRLLARHAVSGEIVPFANRNDL
jgi:uncharacterized protein YndB with AHSA1/START domain